MEDYNNKEDFEYEDTEKQKPKKFVFLIDPQYTSYIDTLSYHEKQELINSLIADHMVNRKRDYSIKFQELKLKKIMTYIFIAVIALPLMIWLSNAAWILSQNNNLNMQSNFERVYIPQ